MLSPTVVRLENVVAGRPIGFSQPVNAAQLIRVELGPLPVVQEGSIVEIEHLNDDS